MKEPAGEANMTVIVVVLIGIIVAVGMIIVPRSLQRARFRSCCNEYGGFMSRCGGDNSRYNCCHVSFSVTSEFASTFSSCTHGYGSQF